MKTRRFLATVLAIAMLASIMSVPVFAEEAVPTLISTATGEGYTCEDLGILIGPGEDGVTEDYLDSLAMRTQAAMINLRLFGLETAALAFDGGETFADAADATEYWQPILEYLKANPGVGWVGDENGNFLPNDYITGQAFTKVLLMALGYEYGLDFDWEITMDFAAEVGLTALADKADADLTVREIAVAIIEALGLKYNDTTDVTLMSKLVNDGVIDEAAAVEAGFEIEAPTLAIVNAYPSAIDEVTVVLNMELPEGTVITLKKGMSGYSTTVASDGSTVTLTAGFAYPAGDWTVTVGETSMDFTIEAQTATGFVFGTDFVYDTGTQDLMVTLADQYGDAMDLGGVTVSVFNATTGFVFTPTLSTTVKINVTEGGAVDSEDEISIFVFDSGSGESASQTYMIKDTPYLASIEIGDVTLGDEDAERLFEGSVDNVLDLEGYDQYGNSMEITFLDLILGNIQILESNDPVISMEDIVDGDMVFFGGVPGTSTITFIIPGEAFVVTSDLITVYPEAELTELTVGDVVIPAEQVGLYVSESALVTIEGVDQYGGAADYDNHDDITFTVTNPAVISAGAIRVGDNSVTVYPFGTGTSVVYVFLNGIMQDSFTITAEAAAYPFKVTGISEDIPLAYTPDSYKTFSGSAFSVVDQYGRTIDDMAVYSRAGYYIEFWDDGEADYLGAEQYEWDSYVIYDSEGANYGTETMTAGIYNMATDYVTPVSIFTFEAQSVSIDDIATFSLDVVDDVLYGGDQNWDTYGQMFLYNNYMTGGSLYPYDNPFLFKGYLEDGTEVALELDGSQVPTIVDVITFSVENEVYYDSMTRKDYPDAPTIYGPLSNAGLVVMKIWINGEMVASDEYTVSLDDFAVTSIEATDEVLSWDDISELQMGSEFWPPAIYPGPEEWRTAMIAVIGDSEEMTWFARYLALEMFTIKEQYNVEMFWMPLLEDGMINFMFSSEEIGDDIYFYFTIMTPDGMIYDTITVVDDYMPDYGSED